jgi:hypothetical protein
MRLQRRAGRMQVDLLLAELQRGTTGAEAHDLHAEHALVEVTAAVDVGDGEDQVVQAFEMDHARSVAPPASSQCAVSGRWRCLAPGIALPQLNRRCAPSARGRAWR